ncbi:hypothetical protein QTP88_025432 [Uroleucon formosanum]
MPLEIEAKSFYDLIKLLDAHFTPVKSYFAARYEFYGAEKNPMETVAEWTARVRTLSIPCGFGSELNIVLRDIFTLGLEKQFKERLFEENVTEKNTTMNKMMDIAMAKEIANKNATKNYQETNEVNFVKGNKFTHMKSTKKTTYKHHTKNLKKDQASENHKQKCQVCGRQNHKSNDSKYNGYICNLCNLVGHLAPMCKNKNNNSDDDDIFLGVSDKFKLISEPNNEALKPLELNVQLNDINIKFQIDTGKLNVNFTSNSNKGQITLYVIKDGGPPLIGRNDLKKFNLSVTQDVNYLNLSYNIDEPKDIKSLCHKYSKVFEKVEVEINGLVKNGVLIPVEHSKWAKPVVPVLKPVFGQVFLVLVDATSKWIECFKVNSLNTTTIIKLLTEVFSRFGLRKSITSDGAKCFSNEVFHSFLKMYGIMHLIGTPYHPQTNGAAESTVKIMKNSIKKVMKNPISSDLDVELNTFLFQYRNTPHTTTKETSTKILLGKSVRFIFDLFKPQTDDIVQSKQMTQIQNSGKRDITFELNEKVLVRDYRSQSYKWKSAVVTKVLGTRNYQVTTDDENFIWKRHVDQMLKNKETYHKQIFNVIADSNNNNKNQFFEITTNSNNNQQRPKRTIRKPRKYD